MQQRDREQRQQRTRSLAEDATGTVHTQRQVLRDLEDVLDLVPALEDQGEREQPEHDAAVATRAIAVQTEQEVRRREQPQVDAVVGEVDRLDVDDAAEDPLAVRDPECIDLSDLNNVL